MTGWIIGAGILGGISAVLGWAIVRGGTMKPTPPIDAADLPTDDDLSVPVKWPDQVVCAGGFESLSDLLGSVRIKGRKVYSLTVYADGSGEYTLSERGGDHGQE